MKSKKFDPFNYDFSKETEYTAVFFSFIMFLIWTKYSRNILNLDISKILLKKETILLSIVILTLQIKSIKQAFIENDYIKYCRKIVFTVVVCACIGFALNFHFLYKNIRYVEKVADKKITINAYFNYRKGRIASQFVEFKFKGKNRSVSISKQTVNRLIDLQNASISPCISIVYRSGLNNTFVLRDLNVISCN